MNTEPKLKNKINSNTIYKGSTYEDAIISALNTPDVWIEEEYITINNDDSKSIFDVDVVFSNYVIKAYGQFNKIRSKRLPKFCNDFVKNKLNK